MDLLASETFPFAVALALTLAIAAIEVVGLLAGMQPSAPIDSALPEIDVEVEVPGEAPADLGPLSQSLSWLSFGRLPALVVLIIMSASFGLIGMAEQALFANLFGFMLHPLLASIPAAIGAAFATHHLGHALARLIPKDQTDAVSTRSFVGQVATVFRGEARSGHPAEAKLVDMRGKTQYVLIEPEEPGEVFGTGSEVVIVRQDGSVYRAITRLRPVE